MSDHKKTLTIGGNVWVLSPLNYGDCQVLEGEVDRLPLADALRLKGRVPPTRYEAVLAQARQVVADARPASLGDVRVIDLLRSLRGAPMLVAMSIGKTVPLFFEETLLAEIEKAGGVKACGVALMIAALDVLVLSGLLPDEEKKTTTAATNAGGSTASSPPATA